ncbi:MAG: tetraacyldisaccharide 4'-kinase [Rhizobacter sp.]|nr:tetraacyldisaccharide 4'-kinase [Rhizobacter sp.]
MPRAGRAWRRSRSPPRPIKGADAPWPPVLGGLRRAVTLASWLQEVWLARGPAAWCLRPLSMVYGLVTRVRRASYRMGLLHSERLPVPVVVVGNLIAGGAGKTPTTMALVRLLRERGFTPGIVSRGYGRSAAGFTLVRADTPATEAGDEPLLMHLRTRAPVAVGSDRVAAARALLAAHPEVDLILSDDGLQHLRLARDAQVIVFDERGAGNGWLLPAGPLREPMPASVPPLSTVLYNAPAPSTRLPGHLARRRLSALIPLREWWAGDARSRALDDWRGRSVVAAAGLARPQRFYAMLRDLGLTVQELTLPDHHAFDALPWPADTADVVVTEKDAVKLKPEAMGGTRVWVATLDFAFDASLASELTQWLPPAPHP